MTFVMCSRQLLKQSFKIFIFIIINVFLLTFKFFAQLSKYFFTINLFNIIIITIKTFARSFKIFIDVVNLLKTRILNIFMIEIKMF